MKYSAYQIIALLLDILLFWFGVAYELRPRNCQILFPKTLCVLVVDFWGFCSIIPGVARILGYTQTTERVELREQKFDYSFRFLHGLEDQFSATEDAVVHLDTCTFWISAT